MAIRVKVKRLTIIAGLEEVLERKRRSYAKKVEKYEEALAKARVAVIADLRAKADRLESGENIRFLSEMNYFGRNDSITALAIESKVKVPRKPSKEQSEEQQIERAIELLDKSDEDVISVSETDLGYYGIGSFIERKS